MTTQPVVPKDLSGLVPASSSRKPERTPDSGEARSFARANWRFTYENILTRDEIALIETLAKEFGESEQLFGTDGPPPVALAITPK